MTNFQKIWAVFTNPVNPHDSSKILVVQIESWTQSYKTSFVVITPFFGVNYVTFLRTNLCVEIYAKIYAKNVFWSNSDSIKQIYRIEKVVYLNYANVGVVEISL